MKKNKRKIFIFAIIPIFIFIGFYFEKNLGITKIVQMNISKTLKGVKVTEERSKVEYKNLFITSNMPEIHCNSKNAQRYINFYIRKSISNYINEKRQYADIHKQQKRLDIHIRYNIAFQDKDIINIVIIKETKKDKNNFIVDKESYVFDLNTGQRIYINNFLKDNSNYEVVIEDYIQKCLKEEDIYVKSSKININKYTNFIMEDGGISVYFKSDDINDKKDIYEFKIPYSIFKNNINKISTSSIVANIDTQTITENNKYINSILNIPIIMSSDKNLDKYINDEIRKNIMDFYNKSYESAKINSDGIDDIENKFVANVDFEVKKNSDNMLSIKTSYYEYSGGLHGNYEDISYNIDMKNGKIIKLGDLFKQESDYISVINNEIRNQIELIVKKDSQYEGVYQFKTIKPDNKFFIQDDNIVIYFDLYEIAPFPAGIVEFKINKNTISHILNNEYIDVFK